MGLEQALDFNVLREEGVKKISEFDQNPRLGKRGARRNIYVSSRINSEPIGFLIYSNPEDQRLVNI